MPTRATTLSPTAESKRALLFAHGAGAPSTSEWMQSWATRLASLGEVRRFDYPYMAAKKKRPDPLPVLVAAHHQAATELAASVGGTLVYIGKSMGGRVGCHLAHQHAPAALVCMGYPLRAPSGNLRDRVLLTLETPILFVQGTRDPLCPLSILADVRARMTAPSELYIVDEGDHSLAVTKRWSKAHGQTQEEVNAAILRAIEGFLTTHAPVR